MSIIELFSKRKKKEMNTSPDVYQYDCIPCKLRNQLIMIIRRFAENDYAVLNSFPGLLRILREEYGQPKLSSFIPRSDRFSCNLKEVNALNELLLLIDETQDTDKIIDFVELFLRLYSYEYKDYREKSNMLIEEINTRFLENAVGYQFESGQMIKIDSKYTHKETIIPALTLLSEPEFDKANEEFLKAHKNYRTGKFQECIVEACKSFESVMKIICYRHNWDYNQGDPAKKLISRCIKEGLIPSSLQTQFSNFQNLLESGIPTIRNKTSSHGQGTQNIIVPESLASYALNLTASNIVFLRKLEKEKLNNS